ncbi:unnamed protein product, partial [Staurois parvus]
YTYLLCAVVLHRAAWILLFLGSPQTILAPPVCRVPPQQAACYGGTRCSVCPFTYGATSMKRQRPRMLCILMDCDEGQVSIEGAGGIAAHRRFFTFMHRMYECMKVKNLQPLQPFN